MARREDVNPDDWDKHWTDISASAAINPAQVYRRQLVLSGLDLGHAVAPRVLDIGSGLGDFLIDVHRVYPSIPKLGIELSRSGVEIASRRLPQADFLQRDLIMGNEESGKYTRFATHAVCSEVLEHVDDPVRLLRNAQPYMADSCRIVVTVPGGPRSKFDLHIGHRRHFTPADLTSVLKQAGFTVELATGAGFPFFNLYRLLVILRGEKLVEEASTPTKLLRSVSALFRLLFRFNISKSPLGWQTFAIARK